MFGCVSCDFGVFGCMSCDFWVWFLSMFGINLAYVWISVVRFWRVFGCVSCDCGMCLNMCRVILLCVWMCVVWF